MVLRSKLRTVWAGCLAAATAGVLVGSQSAPRAAETPSGSQATPTQQTPPTPPQPQFRGEVNVIRLDVSVLDKDRRPVRGLSLADFTVTEDGERQQLVAVSEVDATEQDPAPSAWMRHAPRDMVTNDLVDQVGDGRVYAIVMDDWNLPWDDTEIVVLARATARYIVDGMGPSDAAAVVYAQDSGLSQDFTSDRAKLVEAIDRYNPHERNWVYQGTTAPGPGGGDMPQRFSPILARSTCQRTQPTVPTLLTVAARLATIPERRKTMVLVSTGVPLSLGAARGCPGELADLMRDVYRLAQRANINIHSVDPAGYRGYEDYLQRPVLRGRNMGEGMSLGAATAASRLRRDFLEITADQTGARAVVNTDSVESGIDRIFAEDASYYLVGYQTSHGAPDCKFRKVDVKVNRPGVEIRTRAGYYAACAERLESREARLMPTTTDLGLAGLMAPAGLPLRAVAVALRPSAVRGKVDVGVVLTVRLPASPVAVEELLTVTRNLYEPDGRAGPPIQDKWSLSVPRGGADELRYDVFYTLSLAPGRYELRLNARSAALDRGGSVFAPIEVPDLDRPTIALSGLSLGTRPEEGTDRRDPFAALLPIVPTTARDFAPNAAITASVRVQVGADAVSEAVTVETRLIDARDRTVFEKTDVVAPASFDAARGAQVNIDLPLGSLERGPHVLTVKATGAAGRSARRDLVIRIR